jgi:SAM-dependent methyltransferase
MSKVTAEEPCGVCGAIQWTEVYRGPVRDGVFGHQRPGLVRACGSCGVEVLADPPPPADSYYESGEYREAVGEAAEVESYFSAHDKEQWSRFGLLEPLEVRSRVVADVGCGGGSFLDGVRGMARQTIAIEPMRGYHASLRTRGSLVYPDVDSALVAHAGQIDVLVCFSVIEHVQQPRLFASNMRRLLAPGGVALLSTPNRADVLLSVGCDAYRQFFYRVVHRHYFDAASLRTLALAAGFTSCDVMFRHRFNFGNFITWLGEGRPGGSDTVSPLGQSFDRSWKLSLEESGMADYLYAYCRG